MKRLPVTALLALFVLSVSTEIRAEDILSHDGVGMSRTELEYEVAKWTPEMQEAAANDTGDRLELLNKSLLAKKIANQALQLKEQDNPDLYWKIQYKVRQELERIMIRDHVANLDVPDMNELAQERYLVEKDRWALVPEQRLSSHILILCDYKTCDRETVLATAEGVHQKVIEGEDFAQLAGEYSEDPGSREEGGQFKRWIMEREKGVSREYSEALFALEAVGDVSPVTASQFGFHIIKLDDIKPAYHRTYEEVQEQIITALENEYRTEAARTYVRSFNIDDSAYIDGAAMEEVFSKYKSAEPPKP